MKGNSIHLIFIYFPAFLLAPGPFLKKTFCSLSLVLVNRPFQLVCNTVSGHMSVCAGLISEPPPPRICANSVSVTLWAAVAPHWPSIWPWKHPHLALDWMWFDHSWASCSYVGFRTSSWIPSKIAQHCSSLTSTAGREKATDSEQWIFNSTDIL